MEFLNIIPQARAEGQATVMIEKLKKNLKIHDIPQEMSSVLENFCYKTYQMGYLDCWQDARNAIGKNN